MSEKPRLSDAIEQHLQFRKAEGKSPGTIRNDRAVLRRLLLTVGDLYVSSITDRQINAYLAVAAQTRSARSLGIDHAALSAFFVWAVRGRLVGRFSNPMEGRKAPKHHPKERERVSMKDFPRLLDAAEATHRRDRMIVSLGLYLFLRASEVSSLRVGDVKLDAGELFVNVWKTRQVDAMPISQELDRELRSWLTWYSVAHGPLDPSWYLVPAKLRTAMTRDPVTGVFRSTDGPAALNPTRPVGKIEEVPQHALARIGFRLREDAGESRREGMHTLRRSGARARFDTLERLGYDGAIRHVQTLLHHASMSMTEHYLGITLDRVKRNELIKGQPMFDTGENVVEIGPLREARSGG